MRPYIKGVTDGLSAKGFKIGDANDYVIDYRECPQDDLNDPDNFKPDPQDPTVPQNYLVLCMSTTVVWNASRHEKVKPIVAIVSDHKGVGLYAKNVCGISGQRSQFGNDYYAKFIATVANPPLTTIYVLLKEGYPPALDALREIEKSNPPFDPTVLNVPRAEDIQATINGLTQGSGGLLVLPADWFFAQPQDITNWARRKSLPDFWPVTDWVNSTATSALAGYGVPQKKCGELLGGRIADIWNNNGAIPAGNKFPTVRRQDCVWQASKLAAQGLGITLGNDPNLIQV